MTNLISELYHNRGLYPKPPSYGVYHRGVQLVGLVEAPLTNYAGKDRKHGTGLINLWMGSIGQLVDPRAVQKDSHNMETREENTAN